MWGGRKKKKSTRGRSTPASCQVPGGRTWSGLYTRSCAFLADLFFYQCGRTILQGIFREKLLGLPLVWRYDHPGFWTDNPVALVAGNVVPWPLLGGCTDSLTDRWTKPSTRQNNSDASRTRRPGCCICYCICCINAACCICCILEMDTLTTSRLYRSTP